MLTQEEISELLASIVPEKEKTEMLDITYTPEYSDFADCPVCEKEFDICEAYMGDKKCPHCGQKFNIEVWIF